MNDSELREAAERNATLAANCGEPDHAQAYAATSLAFGLLAINETLERVARVLEATLTSSGAVGVVTFPG